MVALARLQRVRSVCLAAACSHCLPRHHTSVEEAHEKGQVLQLVALIRPFLAQE